MKRLLLLCLLVGGLLTATAAPASAHATVSGSSTFPGSSDVRLTMDVPEERGDATHNSDIKIYLPADWTGKGCDAAAPWHCSITPNALEGRPLVEWTKDAGSAPTTADESFSLTTRTGAPGMYSVPVIQTYANGEVVRWNGAAGSEEPAPTVTVTAAPATTTTTAAVVGTTTIAPAATTTTSAGATTTSAAGATTTTAVGATTSTLEDTTTTTAADTTTSTTSDSASDADADADEGSNPALPIAIAVLIALAIAGGATWFVRRRRAAGSDVPTDPSDPTLGAP